MCLIHVWMTLYMHRPYVTEVGQQLIIVCEFTSVSSDAHPQYWINAAGRLCAEVHMEPTEGASAAHTHIRTQANHHGYGPFGSR